MKPHIETLVLCYLLLLCEASAPCVDTPLVAAMPASEPAVSPTSIPSPTLESTPIPTSTAMPKSTCTTMPWPTDTPTPYPSIVSGKASQYSPGVMERVVAYRQKHGEIPQDVSGYDGFVAVRECGNIGETYYIRPMGQADWEVFLAVDCASKNDYQSTTDPRSGYQWMTESSILVEIDHGTAKRWNCVRRITRIEMFQ